MSRVERMNVTRELVALRRENEQLRETISELIQAGNAQQKRIVVPEPPGKREVTPPWEQEGLSKQKWLTARQTAKKSR